MANSNNLYLGIESSCDESSASVVHENERGLTVLSVATFSQVGIHQAYGGVVPEIASRNHLETINPMINQALKEAKIKPKDLTAVGVTNRPGLVGALLVGVAAAKSFCYAHGLPLVPIHHLEGHAISVFLDQPESQNLSYPLLLAIISGGHTNLYVIPAHPQIWPPDLLKKTLIGQSRDDAAGEAFDKTAKILGFPYPGGKWIDETAKKDGNPKAFDFPRALNQKSNYDFSFSGLKTAVSLTVDKLQKEGSLEKNTPNLCASLQEAIVDSIMLKVERAFVDRHCKSLAIVGGVAANSRLRERLQLFKKNHHDSQIIFPNIKYCTDNAAMIAGATVFRFKQGLALKQKELLELNAIAYPEV